MERTVRTLYLVRQVQLQCRAALEEALAGTGLSTSQYTILSLLARRDGLSAAQLARRYRVTPQSMNAVIASLEEKGLISRREAPDNRRILKATLTSSGRNLMRSCEAALDRAEDELFGALSKAELTAFRQALLKVTALDLRKAPLSA